MDRTPVEIWSRILAFTISCPLLPTDDDNLIANLYLLQYDCEAIAAYWDSERFRLACRLVCKSWRSLLDRYAYRLFLPPLSFSPFPFFQRIQHPPNRMQWAPYHKHDGRRHASCGGCHVRKGPHPDTKIIGKANPNSVIAFVDQVGFSGCDMVDLVARFPGLRILTLRAFKDLNLNKPSISLPTLSSKCTSLTHLALYLFYQVVIGESQVLVLPNLHTLFLHVITGPVDESRSIPLSKWNLPKLRNLGVRANLLRVGKENYEQVQTLIRNVGSHLHGLSFSWRCGKDEEIISDQLWKWCPRLQYLEISTPSILVLWPPPDTHATLAIILMDIKEEFSNGGLVAYARLASHILLPQTTTAESYSFGMPISWATLRRNLDNYPRSTLGPSPLLQLFECFQTLGYSFIDRYGVSIEAEEAKETIKWLEEKYGSVLPNEADPFDEV